MFLLNSRMGPFTAPPRGGPLLPKLRGCFAEFLNEVSLARLGVLAPSHLCRFWYGPLRGSLGVFLAAPSGGLAVRRRTPSPRARAVWAADLPAARLGPAGDAIHQRPRPITRAPRRSSPRRGLGTVDPISVAYALRPRLRPRLTPGGRTCPGKPWDSGGRDSHPPFRYSCPHNRWQAVHGRSRARFAPACHAPLPALYVSASSARRLTPDHFRRGTPRPVSCYALFKWWLPLSQHPGCPLGPTSLAT